MEAIVGMLNNSVEKFVFLSTAEAEKQVKINSKSKNFFILIIIFDISASTHRMAYHKCAF